MLTSFQYDLSYTVANQTVQPGMALNCVVWSLRGETNVDWTADTVITFNDGKKLSHPASGSLKNVGWTQSTYKCVDVKPEDAKVSLGTSNGREVDEKGNPVKGKRSSPVYFTEDGGKLMKKYSA